MAEYASYENQNENLNEVLEAANLTGFRKVFDPMTFYTQIEPMDFINTFPHMLVMDGDKYWALTEKAVKYLESAGIDWRSAPVKYSVETEIQEDDCITYKTVALPESIDLMLFDTNCHSDPHRVRGTDYATPEFSGVAAIADELVNFASLNGSEMRDYNSKIYGVGRDSPFRNSHSHEHSASKIRD